MGVRRREDEGGDVQRDRLLVEVLGEGGVDICGNNRQRGSKGSTWSLTFRWPTWVCKPVDDLERSRGDSCELGRFWPSAKDMWISVYV